MIHKECKMWLYYKRSFCSDEILNWQDLGWFQLGIGGGTGEKFRVSLESTKFNGQIGTFPFVEVCSGNKDEKSECR